MLALTMVLHFFTPLILSLRFFFFFNDTATTEIYTLSLHDALPISIGLPSFPRAARLTPPARLPDPGRSEEHTSELQSLRHLVCRLLLEKKNKRPLLSVRPAICPRELAIVRGVTVTLQINPHYQHRD